MYIYTQRGGHAFQIHAHVNIYVVEFYYSFVFSSRCSDFCVGDGGGFMCWWVNKGHANTPRRKQLHDGQRVRRLGVYPRTENTHPHTSEYIIKTHAIHQKTSTFEVETHSHKSSSECKPSTKIRHATRPRSLYISFSTVYDSTTHHIFSSAHASNAFVVAQPNHQAYIGKHQQMLVYFACMLGRTSRPRITGDHVTTQKIPSHQYAC